MTPRQNRSWVREQRGESRGAPIEKCRPPELQGELHTCRRGPGATRCVFQRQRISGRLGLRSDRPENDRLASTLSSRALVDLELPVFPDQRAESFARMRE